MVLEYVCLVVIGWVVEGDNDNIGLPIVGAREGSVGRPQPDAILIKSVAGCKVGRLKCTRAPDGLVCKPAERSRIS